MKKRIYKGIAHNNTINIATLDAPEAQIHNIVSTTQICTDAEVIDLLTLSKLLPFTFYDKQRFAAITIRGSNPNCTALLFTSGKLVITGGTSWYECLLTAKHIAKTLQKTFVRHKFWIVSCEIQNIVAKTAVPLKDGQKLDICSMYEDMNTFCTYQKTMFPGLIFRPCNSPVVLLCFTSGKIVITGGKTRKDVFIGWGSLWSTIKRYIRDQT